MSADSYHATAEKQMRKVKNIYDGNDFFAIINATGHGFGVGVSIQMPTAIIYPIIYNK